MKPFRRPSFSGKTVLSGDGMDYGLPYTGIEPEEISLGVDTSSLLDLIGKGEV